MVVDSDVTFGSPQIEAVQGTLRSIAKLNAEAGCTDRKTLYQEFATRNAMSSEDVHCWIPIVSFIDVKEKFLEFVSVMTEFEHHHAVIMGIEAQDPTYSIPRQFGTKGVWVLSYEMDTTTYIQHSFTLSPDGRSTTAVSMVRENLLTLPAEAKDAAYTSHIQYLRHLANEPFQNNPIVGQSGLMPVARSDFSSCRRCHAGECEIGILFTDALRWWADVDFAFITSGGLRGQGWPAGDVSVLKLWDALPYPNILCTGTMSGVSLFRLLDHSVKRRRMGARFFRCLE
jgi:2',3'-cyclic-nucleotide 2'-phosphodiesterase (5'-nucleotidase family)